MLPHEVIRFQCLTVACGWCINLSRLADGGIAAFSDDDLRSGGDACAFRVRVVDAGAVDYRWRFFLWWGTAALCCDSVSAHGLRIRRESPPQIYGSNQIELSWTVIPILIVVMLFLSTTRVILETEAAPKPASSLDVTVIGHQFWWEYRYPKLGVVTANELHVPVSDPAKPTPTYLAMSSADTDHSFWVPRLAGKTDLIPNRLNTMWIDPQAPGLYLGTVCAVLRDAACEDAAAGVCTVAGGLCCVDQAAAEAGGAGSLGKLCCGGGADGFYA